MQLYCFPGFSMTLGQRSSGGLEMLWESLRDLTWVLPAHRRRARCCRAMRCALRPARSRKPLLLGLFAFFPGPDAILWLSHCTLKSVQLLNPSSFMSVPSAGAPGSAPFLLLLLVGCWDLFFFPPHIFFLWVFLLFSQHSSIMISHTSRS